MSNSIRDRANAYFATLWPSGLKPALEREQRLEQLLNGAQSLGDRTEIVRMGITCAIAGMNLQDAETAARMFPGNCNYETALRAQIAAELFDEADKCLKTADCSTRARIEAYAYTRAANIAEGVQTQ